MSVDSAPRAFVSYSHDSEEHRENVLELVQTLRRNGVNAWADFFVESSPPKNWPLWMHNQIEDADYVLVVVTETYARRFNQKEEPGVGAGVRWEGTLITSDLYYDTTDEAKYIPVLFSQEDVKHIPKALGLTNRYVISPSDDSTLTPLLRHILQSPEFIPAAIGEAPSFLTREAVDRSDSPIDPRINSAVLLSTDDAAGAVKELTQLLESLRGPQRAHAYFALGQIHQRTGYWSQAITAYRRALESNPDTETMEAASRNLTMAFQAIEAHFREGGPVDAATKFVKAVRKGRMDRAWEMLSPTLRQVLVQAWLWANREHPEVAPHDREVATPALCMIRSKHPLRRAFMATQLGELQQAFSGIDTKTWGAAANPRPIGLDYELVLLSPTDGSVIEFNERTGPLRTAPFLMKQMMGEWKVDNFRPAYPIPGWPPSHEEIPPEQIDYFAMPNLGEVDGGE
ncbi:SEFIR domain-containing protein [Streptomyces sp. NPDC057412]|uniref:SEFIR domain-containing protein n=1 Tax=Streptomyces sp. NPDC057412 TaxID=3346123 RepID=UPI0036AF2DA9